MLEPATNVTTGGTCVAALCQVMTVILSIMHDNPSEEKLQEFGCELAAEAVKNSTGSLLLGWSKKTYSADSSRELQLPRKTALVLQCS